MALLMFDPKRWQGHPYCGDEHIQKTIQQIKSVSHFLSLHQGHKIIRTKRIHPGLMTAKIWLVLECSDCKVWWVYDEVMLNG